jgi:spore coat protein U-like protein
MPMRREPGILVALAGLALLARSPAADAQQLSCNVVTPSMDFGTYLPMNPVPLDLRGRLRIRCNGGGLGMLHVTIGPGASGNAFDRHMTGPRGVLRYNIFLDAAHSAVWGDGTGGTSQLRRVVRGNRRNFNDPIYGRVYANQDPDPGLYTDDLVVTVIF